MKTKFLFPNNFIKIGWSLILLGVIMLLLSGYMEKHKILTHIPVFSIYDSGVPLQDPNLQSPIMQIKYDDIRFELTILLFVIGCLFVGFSKLKIEDEFTTKLRLESLLWSMYFVLIAFIMSIIFIYGMIFIEIPLICLLSFLVIYIIRFYYVYYQSLKLSKNEK